MPAPFTPVRNYAGTNHVLGAPSQFIHPINGNIYVAIIEQISGARQDLAIYRLPGGANVWQEVKRYQGTVDSVAQIAFGSVVIGQGGNMIVVTSLVIPGAPKVTGTGFQGVWLREMGIDIPYPPLSVGASNDDLLARILVLEHLLASQAYPAQIADLQARVAHLELVNNRIHLATV